MDVHGNITEHKLFKAADFPGSPKAAEPPELPKKMRKVMLGGVEMQVEEGSTMTIGGVSVVIG